MLRSALVLSVPVLMVMACSKPAEPPPAPAPAPAPAPVAPPPAPAPAPAAAAVKGGQTQEGDVLVVTIVASDAMQYDNLKITAKAGQKVKLTLVHGGTLQKTVMGHNFVLLKQGTDVAAFAGLAAAAAATEYIPADKSAILANTKTIGGGESDTIEFVAPAAGSYDYICSFPGHYSIMRGKLEVG
jgi:azurin